MAARRRTTVLARVLLVAGLAVLAGESAVFCLFGTSVYDEGGYLYEGWVTVAHGQLPFRDFFAKLPPLLYYLYGAGQALCGPSVLVGRLESALFMFGGLALAAWIAWRLGGRWAAALVVWLLAGNPFALNYYLHAYAVAPTAFFILLAAALLLVARPRPAALWGGQAALAAVLLCRHDMLPLAAVLWVAVLWRYPVRPAVRVGSVLLCWGLFALVMLPFALQAPEGVLRTLTIGKLGPHLPSVGGYAEATPASPASIVWHTVMFLRAMAGVLLLLAVGWVLLKRSAAGSRPPGVSVPPLAWLLAAAAVLWLSHVPAAVAIAGNVFYLLDPYIFFLLAAPAAVLWVWLARALQAGDAQAVLARWACVAVAAFAVAMPIFTGPGPQFELSLRRPTELARIRLGAQALARNIPAGSTVFTIDDPHQFLEAGRLLPGALTHELFSYRESTDTALVRRLHLFNDEMIREWLSGGAPYAVISGEARQFLRDSGRYAGGRRLDALIMGPLDENYTLIAEVPGTWAGPLRIYKWKVPVSR